jgi:hypothetical protein
MPDDAPPTALATTEATTALRERVIAQLSEAFAHGTLDMDELERRVTVAHTARSPAEVEALVAGLTPAVAAPLAPRVETLPAAHVQPTGRLLCVMGGASRRGVWTVPRHLKVTTIFGGAELDFREARLPAGPVDMVITSVMGGVHVVVPPGLAVEAYGSAVMGGFEEVHRSAPNLDPDAPLLRIHGLAVMGGVQIEMRLPGEPALWDDAEREHREGRARRRLERKERREERRALRGREKE